MKQQVYSSVIVFLIIKRGLICPVTYYSLLRCSVDGPRVRLTFPIIQSDSDTEGTSKRNRSIRTSLTSANLKFLEVCTFLSREALSLSFAGAYTQLKQTCDLNPHPDSPGISQATPVPSWRIRYVHGPWCITCIKEGEDSTVRGSFSFPFNGQLCSMRIKLSRGY